jgi:hypothetical protein
LFPLNYFVISPSSFPALPYRAGGNLLQLGKPGDRVGLARVRAVKQKGIPLIVVLGPFIGPANLPRGVLGIVVVDPVQRGPFGRARADMSKETTKLAKLGMHKPMLLLSLEHVPVAVGFRRIAAT